MILMSFAAIVAAMFALIDGRVVHFVFIYLLAGLFWIFQDKRIPVCNRPLYVSNRISRYLMVFIWPIRFFAAFKEYLYYRRHPGRFKVIFGSPEQSETVEFKSYDEALSFARERSKDIKGSKKVFLFDVIKNKGFLVRPNGRVDVL